jgi:hypothetical protein
MGSTFPHGGYHSGYKHKPLKTKHGSVQVDGLAMEFNSYPAATEKWFSSTMSSQLSRICRVFWLVMILVFQLILFLLLISIRRWRRFRTKPKSWDATWTLTHILCHPTKSHVRVRSSVPGQDISTSGFTNKGEPDSIPYVHYCAAIVRELDYYLGLPSLKWDTDGRRRKLYGKAGAFRPKPYGLEYRVLSNKWLSDEKLIGLSSVRPVMRITTSRK